MTTTDDATRRRRAEAPVSVRAPTHLAAPPRDPSLLYAVGDVHGCRGLLEAMLATIESDAAGRGRAPTVVFLGDVINRGPDSAGVVARLLEGPSRPGDRWITLRGNHEQALLDGLADGPAWRRFLDKSGGATLRSYGLSETAGRAKAHAAIPDAHVAFLRATPLTYRRGGYVLVHAGVRPGRPLEAQDPETLMNIRRPFFEGAARLPFTVVHGHSPSAGAPVIAPGRIGLDTGAVVTGVLTAAALEDDAPPRFLTVRDARARMTLS